MSGSYENAVTGSLPGIDPLDDPLVLTWDAVIRGDRTLPPGADPAVAAVIRRFQSGDVIPSPSDDFFADLERQLARLERTPSSSGIERLPSLTAQVDGSWPPTTRRRSILNSRSYRFITVAAALLVLLIAGPLLVYLTHPGSADQPAIPAAVVEPPTMETLGEMDFLSPLWDMPPADAWEQMEFSMFLVDPGATFSTDIPWYTSVDGPLLIVALSGDLIVEPAGPARVFRNGIQERTEHPAGDPVILRPNDAIAFSSTATAIGRNPGSEPVRALYGLMGVYDDGMANSGVDADDVTRVDINYEAALAIPPAGASLSLTHLALAPLDMFVYETPAGWVLPEFVPLQINNLRVYDGVANELSPEILAEADYASLARLKYPESSQQTLINIGDETVDLYFMVIEPYPDTATPVP